MGFTLQAFGPFLHWMTLGVLAAAPILVGFLIYKLGSLPGSLARSRMHPQAEAIGICGWMGVITIVLWPIAMVWAYLVPDKREAGAAPAGSDQAALATKIRQVTQRIADLEAGLARAPVEGR